ncbi:MAG: polyribonucleotide nucleotidyltransferase [Acidimicrobiia bacterium]|nr:polyribonucleotide nucleotidyltransferase [Acidimicrobiia bacterium]
MADAIRVEGPINAAGTTLSFETGKLARLADGAVFVQIGNTTLLSTVATSKPREGIDFFPLTVDVEERMYAAGKIPGSFFRREGRPGEQAILTCRLTDRPLRPSFPADFRNEVQVIATVMGADMENPHDIASINGASAALMVSGIPFNGPIGAVRIARVDDEWIAHPTYHEGAESIFEMVVAGRKLHDGDVAVMMVEAGGTAGSFEKYAEGTPKVNEETIADGLEWSKQWILASIELQLELVKKVQEANGPIETIAYTPNLDYQDDAFDAIADEAREAPGEALAIADKNDRNRRLDEIRDAAIATLVGSDGVPGPFAGRGGELKKAFRSLQKQIVRDRIVKEGVRIDGRGVADLRPLEAEIGVIPTAHGTGLFQRGETQVLSVTTLGMPRMEQMVDSIGTEDRKRYMHHYNFPPFSTGETGRVGSPKRREIGHGVLAERAIVPVLPSSEDWPYTIRVVSDVLSSNGSTSMASVCGSSMALMDSGTPIKAPVAGIAMGLVLHDGEYVTLTDILGQEDAFGDMDFKVAGTADAVTALQLDTKIDGIPADVLAKALLQARDARLKILDVMQEAIDGPRDDVRPTAPKIISIQIPIDKIGEVIGPKGKVINTITQETGADVSVSDDGVVGTVSIGSKESSAVEEARRRIELILDPPTAELGANYTGRVVNVTKFGAFVNVLPGRDGLLHISKLGGGKRVDRVEDVLNLGDEVQVRVDDIDNSGKLSLSLVGEDGEVHEGAPREQRESGPRDRDRSGDRGRDRDRDRGRDRDRDRGGNGESANDPGSAAKAAPSFEDSWEAQATEEFGDLGPAEAGRSGGPGSGGGGGRRGGGGGGGGGRRRR